MDPRLERFIKRFSFRINYKVLRYIVVCGAALVGAWFGAILSGGDLMIIILAGVGCYIAGRIIVWVIYHEY
jgi:hypothetical protein